MSLVTLSYFVTGGKFFLLSAPPVSQQMDGSVPSAAVSPALTVHNSVMIGFL